MTESWLGDRAKGWLKDYVAPKKTVPPPVEKDTQAYGVIFYPIKCPQCNSKNTKCYASKPPIRYHKCKDCKTLFKSHEAE